MSIKIGSNIASLQAQRRLGEATSSLEAIYERLSSGQRINKASDDAAGLAVSLSLNASSRIFAQGIRNVNDSISLLQIGSSALDSLTNITIRQKELATQAAQGIYGSKQLTAIDNEAQALVQEYNRIISTTKFNNRQLLDSPTNLSVQAGIGSAETLQATLGAGLSVVVSSPSSFEVSGGGNESWTYSNFSVGETQEELSFDDSFPPSSGNYFDYYLNYADGTGGDHMYVWYNVDGAGGDPGLSGAYGIEVDISSSDPSYQIASATFNAINNSSYGNAQYADSLGYSSSAFILHRMGDVSSLNHAGFPGLGIVSETKMDSTIGAGSSIVMQFSAGQAYGQDYYVWFDYNDLRSDPGGIGTGIKISLYDDNGNFADPITESTYIAQLVASAIDAVVGGTITTSVNATTGSLTLSTVGLGPVNSAWNLVNNSANSATPNAIRNSIGANPGMDLVSNVLTSNNHGFSTGTAVTVSLNGGGTLPNPLSSATTYYAIKTSNNTFKLATSAANAQAGTAVDLTTYGSTYTSLTFSLVAAAPTTQSNYAENISLSSRSSALTSMDTLERQFQRIQTERGNIGVFMSRLSATLNVLQSRNEGYITAASRITSADIAADSAALVRTQILQQAASGVLAQANQAPSLALILLNGR